MTCLTYYFVIYAWKSSFDTQWNFSEELIKVHPVQWLIDMRKNYSEDTLPGGKLNRYTYALVNWKEVSKEVYDNFKDEVG